MVILITFVVFWVVREGTDPVASYLRTSPRATPAQILQYQKTNGLQGGIVNQYLSWGRRFVTGNWAPSIKGSRPVWPELKNSFGNSIILGLAGTIFGVFVGLAIGIVSALRQYSKFDSAATAGAFVGISVPPFISGILVQVLFAVLFTKWLGLTKPFLPTSGIYPPGHKGFDLLLRLKYLILPTFVISIQIIASYSRYMRSSLLDVTSAEYLRTARAKGISERQVIVRHALRNAMVPIVTIAALDFGTIVGGLIITEFIFEYPGLGRYFILALNNGDFPLLMPWVVMVVVSVIMFNLLADVMYAWLDPRIRLG